MNRSRKAVNCAAGMILAAAIASIAAAGTDPLSTLPPQGADANLRGRLMAVAMSPNLGGDTTVAATGPRAFRSIASNSPNEHLAPFLFGQRLFDVVWDDQPVIQPLFDGRGPLFNRTACRECHEGNGRGEPPESYGAPMKSILVRLSISGRNSHGGPKPVPNYGDQLQDRAVEGVAPEGQAVIAYEENPGAFADGTPYSLRKPTVKFVNLAYGELPPDVLLSARVALPVIGLGLLQAIPEESLRALADPDDSNGDGISGRVNWVWDAPTQKMAPGRFGWKANVATVRHQNAGAALGDIGLTSPVFADNLCEEVQKDCQAAAARAAATGNSPEIVPELFNPLETYMLLLAVPRQRHADDPAVQLGQALFRAIGCSGCHLPTMVAGKSSLPELSGQVFHPFSDLLLHDMGEGLADHRPDFEASGSEWRTQPLWGNGLTEDVSGFQYFLHDGRARSRTEAILWHGGEAARPREAFLNLGREQRDELLAFLGSL